jgi:hypothetical protein
MSKPRAMTPIAALPEADGVMEQFDRLHAILAETHTAIPALLARQRDLDRELGLTESEALRKQLADVVRGREDAVRRRAAAIAAIMELEAALQAERAAVERRRQAQGIVALAEFRQRYDDCLASLQALWAEGRLLGETLRIVVPMASPMRVQISAADSIPRAMPILSNAAAAVDDGIVALSAQVDEFDSALSLIGALKQARELDVRHRALTQQRTGAVTRMEGLFTVVKDFSYFGVTFAAGMLIDRTMLPDGVLHRFVLGRNIRVADGAAAAA